MVSALVKGDCIVAVLFIFIIFLLQRHGQGTEILSCATEYEGRWKENRKHGPGTKKLKTGMTEEQVGIQTVENRSFRLENQMVRIIPFGKLQKIWAVFCDDVIFLLFLVCSADLDMVCSGSSSHHVKLYSLMFMHKIITRVVCVNGRQCCS